MKRVKKLIKLTRLNSERLDEKELSHAVSGVSCHCGCFYANCGGSSTTDNGNANSHYDFISIIPNDQAQWG